MGIVLLGLDVSAAPIIPVSAQDVVKE